MAVAFTEVRAPRTILLDLGVVVMASLLVAFLLMTMTVRRHDADVVKECQTRLMALSQAEQAYLIKKGRFAESIDQLRPYLEPEYKDMPFTCPITGNRFEVAVQGQRYILLAPGTGFSVLTGDPNW